MVQPAAKAAGIGAVAMQFDDFRVGDPGTLVQSVDVLRDHPAGFTVADQFRDRSVAAIRFRIMLADALSETSMIVATSVRETMTSSIDKPIRRFVPGQRLVGVALSPCHSFSAGCLLTLPLHFDRNGGPVGRLLMEHVRGGRQGRHRSGAERDAQAALTAWARRADLIDTLAERSDAHGRLG